MLDNQAKVIESADYVLEHLDPNNFKALMRRAYALRDNYRFDLALKDLRKLRELMHPKDSAIQEVKVMHNQCVKGVKELGASFD